MLFKTYMQIRKNKRKCEHEIVEKLVEFGMPDFNIEELLKKKKVEASYGVFTTDATRTKVFLKTYASNKKEELF